MTRKKKSLRTSLILSSAAEYLTFADATGSDSELGKGAVVREFRITAADGKTCDTKHSNLSAIIAVGYNTNSERVVRFHQWATRAIEGYTVKAYAMDNLHISRGSAVSDRYSATVSNMLY